METFPNGGEGVKGLPTIKDVAQRAGVGIATVSRVLNGHPSISPEARTRVLEAIDALGFRPSQAARTMVTRSSRTLGLMIPDIRNSFFPGLARGFEDEAHRSGFGVTLADTDENLEREAVYLDMLLDNRVAGVAFTGTGTPDERVQTLRDKGLPVVSLNVRHFSLGVSTVSVDNVGGMAAAVRHVAELGHRSIAYLAAPQKTQAGVDRLTGFRLGMEEAGLAVQEHLIHEGDYLMPSGYEGTLKLFGSNPEVTAVLAASDLMAIGALKALKRLGLDCPRDVSVVGFNNLVEATLVEPELTTVSTDSYRQGRSIAQALIRQVRHPSDPPQQKLLPFHLIVRQSTAAPSR